MQQSQLKSTADAPQARREKDIKQDEAIHHLGQEHRQEHSRTMSLLGAFEKDMKQSWENTMRETPSLYEKLHVLAAGHAAIEGVFSEFASKGNEEQLQNIVKFLERQTAELERRMGAHGTQDSTIAQLKLSLEESRQATTL